MKVLKFGGKSLANGDPINKSIEIILNAIKNNEVAIVVSARGNDTDKLLHLAKIAKEGNSFREELVHYFSYHKEISKELSFDLEFASLYDTLKAIQSLKIYNNEILDKIVAYGETISAKIVAYLINAKGSSAIAVDARQLIIAEKKNNELIVNQETSKQLTKSYFAKIPSKCTPIVTGFIASNPDNNTITLGRNGSNYTATLLANFLNASEVQNWTNINGFFTADPSLVKTALPIAHLSFKEANELAQFGANIIHPKTIVPLVEKNIPLIIKNSFEPFREGTRIDQEGAGKGIKAVNVIRDCALVYIEGKGMADRVGIDARIFQTLKQNNISVKLISQASSERSIGFIVSSEDASAVKDLLRDSFVQELERGDINSINVNYEIAVIAITGKHNYALEKAISGLRKNKIWLHLITNSISGEHISLVVDSKLLKKAVNVVHNHVFGAQKTINVFAFGKGTVGKTFIKQVLGTKSELSFKRNLQINLIGVADSQKYIFNSSGISENWESELRESNKANDLSKILNSLKDSELENIVLVDNTANSDLANQYERFVSAGFDVIASNKIANTLPYSTYQSFRKKIREKNRHFLYETNVGAGLPVIDTIKHLVDADENIREINGVFSGSLSYIFNTFSSGNQSFSEVLLDAQKKGFTEPDPRVDLSGIDVARKLLILAREIGHEANFEDIQIESLIPEQLQSISSWEDFEKEFEQLNKFYDNKRLVLNQGEVLRYIGQLHEDGRMVVKLNKYSPSDSLAHLQDADSLIQIFTDSYGNKPIIIQGAGAGAEVTARGVYSDLIRIGNLN